MNTATATTAPAPGTTIEPTDPRVEHADPITHELTVRLAGALYIAYGERAADGSWTYRIF